MTHILEHFKKADKKLYPFIEKYIDNLELKKDVHINYFEQLCSNIIYQQLSGKAAGTIYGRFLDLFPNKKFTPEQLLAVPHEKLRGVGLSNAKARYVKNIAQAQLDGAVDFKSLDKQANEEIIKELVQIKGVGIWTAEMFMIFTMAREDVFSTGDLGLKKGFMKVYKLKEMPKPKAMLKKSEKWKPYRSYASLALWRVADEEKEK